MPELPEVESIKKQFNRYLVGHKIISVDIKNRRIFPDEEKKIVGAKILGARRFGKVSAIDLDNGFSIVSHIKLTGQFIYKGPNLIHPEPISPKVVGGVPGPHTHVIFNLDEGGVLYYNDVRRFGWIKIIETSEVETTGFVGKLGPEPFGKLTFEYFQKVLQSTKRSIKVVLMDQEKMGGVGNIYANDALWLAKIDPKTPADKIDIDNAKRIYDAVHDVLRNGMKYGGASELSFVTPDGQEGEYQRHTLAYGRDGTICTRCKKAKFEKYYLSGRGTYVCPVCQKSSN